MKTFVSCLAAASLLIGSTAFAGDQRASESTTPTAKAPVVKKVRVRAATSAEDVGTRSAGTGTKVQKKKILLPRTGEH